MRRPESDVRRWGMMLWSASTLDCSEIIPAKDAVTTCEAIKLITLPTEPSETQTNRQT